LSAWEAIIGLEIHVQLKTRTKMFCRCATSFGDEPNSHTCPVCLAHPGALPVPNRTAVEWTVKLGLALGCDIAQHAVFHRKNYFYFDLPKGYQISQYDEPLCVNGEFSVPEEDGEHRIGIVRAHLEEDAAKTVHVGGESGRIVGAGRSLVDFNRGGTPLVEIVTQPDIRSADEARRFLQLLRQTIVELGISDAEMEKGTLRCDANISVRQVGESELRTRWELKNMNSFAYIGRGIDAAVREQIALHEAGEPVIQETYDYDPDRDALTPHRTKEEAEDYRYFPEPDLVPLEPEAELIERMRAELPELPAARIQRLHDEYGVSYKDAYSATPIEALMIAQLIKIEGIDGPFALTWLKNDVVPSGVDLETVNLEELAKILQARGALPRETYTRAIAASGTPGFTADEYLADQLVSDDSELESLVERVLAANPEQVAAYRAGKTGLAGFLVGQVMKESGGRANAKRVSELVAEKLGS
jgi:aspartyl-tRNA(Asn)/glutamyl-tRNA(Gln) amidotransferase subunit B